MASKVYFSPFIPAFSSNGLPVPGARLYFFYTGTTTPAPIYADDDLTTPLTNPVVADAAGRYPRIYLDGEVTYRVRQTGPTGVSLGDDIDPYIAGTSSEASDELIAYAEQAARDADAAGGSAATALAAEQDATTSAQLAASYALAAGTGRVVGTADVATVIINPDGMTGTITWRGFKDGGTSSFTADTTPKLVMMVADKGFDRNGNATIKTRSIVATVDYHQPYPLQTSTLDTEDAYGATRQVYFSEPIFAKSNVGFTNSGLPPFVSVASGLYVDNGTGGSGVSSLAGNLVGVNMSTRAYPSAVPNWACSAYLRGDADGFDFEIYSDNEYGFDGCPFARAEVIVTDSEGVTSTGNTNELELSAQVTATDPVAMVGKVHVSTTGLTDGAGTARLRIYSWLGDEVWDSDVDGFTWPTPQVASIPVLIDVAGDYVPAYAALDTVSGNDGTAAVSTTQATAQASPYATWAAARAAIKTFNNARGHNDHAGGVVLLKQDIAGFGESLAANITVGLTWFTVKPWSTVTARTIGLTEAVSTTNRIIANRIAFEDLFIRSTTNTYVLDGAVDDATSGLPQVYARFKGCKISASATTNGTPVIYQVGLQDYIGCVWENPGTTDLTRFGVTRAHHRLHLGCTHTTTSTADSVAVNAWTQIGNSYQNVILLDPQLGNTNLQPIDGGIHVNNRFMGMRAASNILSDRGCTTGRVVAQNVFELITGVVAGFQISADSSTSPCTNVISRFNTVVGGRTNAFYNDTGDAAVEKEGVDQYSLHYQWNIKSHTFSPESGNRTGNWGPLNGVGMFGRHITNGATGADTGASSSVAGVGSWLGVFLGLKSTTGTAVTYLHDGSALGTAVGGGTYFPTSGATALYDKVAAGRAPYPLDIVGNPRLNDGHGSCSAYEVYNYVVTRPNFVLSEAWNDWWNSKGFGTNTPGGVANSNISQLRTMVTSGPSPISCHMGASSGDPNTTTQAYFCNGGKSGDSSAQIDARMATLAAGADAAEMGRHTLIGGNVNDYNTGVVTGAWAKAWPTNLKTTMETSGARVTGGKRVYYYADDAEGLYCGGNRHGADHVYFRRIMRAAHGNKFVWLERHLHDLAKPGPSTSADQIWVNDFGSVPISLRTTNAGVAVAYNPAAILYGSGAPSDLNYADGQLYINTAAATPTLHFKSGASGTGSWVAGDDKHFNVAGQTAIAGIKRDLIAADQGTAPPFIDAQEFSFASNVAAGAVLGQLVIVGTATSIDIRQPNGAPDPRFAVSAGGQITYTGVGTLEEGITRRHLYARNAYGILRTPVDLAGLAPTTRAAPVVRTIASPGFTVGGRGAHGMADSTAFWFVMHGSWTLASQTYLFSFLNALDASNAKMNFRVLSSGRLSGSVTNASNTLIINYGSKNVGATADELVPNLVNRTIFFSADTTGVGTHKYFLNDTDVPANSNPFAVSGGATLPFASMYPQFLSNEAPSQSWTDAASGQHVGNFGLFAMGAGYMDWSTQANRRAFMNADGTPANRTKWAAVDGKTPAFEFWADGNLLNGESNPSDAGSLVVPTRRAARLMGLVG